MRIIRSSDGRTNLHIWREGSEYWCQKSPVFLKEWTNVVFSVLPYPPHGPVNYFDVRKPLPCPAGTFDAIDVYHVLEHLKPSEAGRFVSELHRVLKLGGVCRVSVPDLERICKDYIQWLEKSLAASSPSNLYRYYWSVWEIFDQIVREKPGGQMLEALRRDDLDVEFIKARYGDVFAEFYGKATPEPARLTGIHSNRGLAARACRKVRSYAYRFLRRRRLRAAPGDPRVTREAVQWMWDRLSLRRLLEEAGFVGFQVKTFATSDIPNWDRYNLDKSNYGDHEIDPSVYVEAKKGVPLGEPRAGKAGVRVL